jgi:DNA polymerase-3 subunit delta'
MKFSEIIGQNNIKRSLLFAKKENRIPHALLFVGPEGCGKLGLAIAFSQYINCEDPQEDDSCGTCISCLKYKKLIHPDLHFVFPLMKVNETTLVCNEFLSEWREMLLADIYFTPLQWYSHIGRENKQGVIYAEEASEIIKKLNLKTFEAEYKCMIIWLPEKMNITAANKLLKILEEPPDKTVFILVAEETELLLPTLLSRCQSVKIPPIKDSDLYEALQKQSELTEHDIKNAVMLAEGNFIKASLILANSSNNQQFLDNFKLIMRAAFAFNMIDIIKQSDEIASFSKEKQKDFLLFMLKIIRDNFLITEGAGTKVIHRPEEAEFSSKFHPFINQRNVFTIVNEIEKAHFHLERNGSPKIVLLDMMLSIARVIKS